MVPVVEIISAMRTIRIPKNFIRVKIIQTTLILQVFNLLLSKILYGNHIIDPAVNISNQTQGMSKLMDGSADD